MSKELLDTNLSVAGNSSQKLSTIRKVGLALSVVGTIVFLWSLYADETDWSIRKIGALLSLLIGSGVVLFRKWYQTLGSFLFVGGLLTMFRGYLSSGEDRFVLLLIAFAVMLLGAAFFTFDPSKKYTLIGHYTKGSHLLQKIGLFLSLLGLGVIAVAWYGIALKPEWAYLTASMVLMATGVGVYTYGAYAGYTKGIKNNYVMFNSLSSRGMLGWMAAIALTLFYIQLYWNSEQLEAMIRLFDPLAQLLKGKDASQWFVYGTLYTFVILFLGIKFMVKYRHNRYQLIRTGVVIFSQLVLAYFIPNIMEALNYDSATAVVDGKSKYLGYYNVNPVHSWPLNYGAYTPGTINAHMEPSYQPFGMAYLFWGIILFLVATPIVTYYVGKRWYCSWFCGCGGLAETAGDSWRHLSNKTVKAWNIERWVIHSVMVFVLIMTIAVLIPYVVTSEYTIAFASGDIHIVFLFVASLLLISAILLILGYRKFKHKVLAIGGVIMLFLLALLSYMYLSGEKNVFLLSSTSLKKTYGFFVGSAFSGVIGVGFYPILGNRVWCRFGCPMAGYMGLFQRFKSRFRITTNGSQCISCGNCSTYCEQGIDVRFYAQKGENIVRSSCVGCGICSAVCPRGVLKLENGPEKGRFEPNPLVVSKDGVTLNM